MIKTILFDMGGVVITLDQRQAIERFKSLGLADAEQRLDAYTQQGIFGDLEAGKITDEEFRHGEFFVLARKFRAPIWDDVPSGSPLIKLRRAW